MLSFKTAARVAFLAILVMVVECSTSGGGGMPAHDLTNKGDLQRLLGSKVVNAEVMKRPLDGWKREYGPLSHSGVRVTLQDGSQHLVHKGRGVGLSSQTVVTDARHMSSKWRATGESRNFGGQKTVSDFIRAGGKRYNIATSNCHIATRSMMRQPAGSRRVGRLSRVSRRRG
ncbi:hypothetical protein ACEWY4_009768 [Coilia grayii]|uniref:Uncharacterized protein n=1 Tax=Coilia grayii TaxID=363190 RepID=A0ABD1K7K6_9TELE